MKRNYLLLEDLQAIVIWSVAPELERIWARLEYLDGKKGYGFWIWTDSEKEADICEELAKQAGQSEDEGWARLSWEEAMLMLGL